MDIDSTGPILPRPCLYRHTNGSTLPPKTAKSQIKCANLQLLFTQVQCIHQSQIHAGQDLPADNDNM